jgi:glycosyltransferase involved in cell wall biosynthesis
MHASICQIVPDNDEIMITTKQEPSIVYHLNSVTMGGMETHTIDLATGIARCGKPVYAIVPEDSTLEPLVERLESAGIEVYRLTLNGKPPQRLARNWWRLWRWLVRHRINLFHQQRTGPYHGKWAVLAAKAARVPVVVATEHQSAYPLKGLARRLNALADRLVDRIIVVSRSDWERQMAHSGRTRAKVTTIYHGIEINRYYTYTAAELQARRAALGFDPNAPLIGSVARLAEQKGLEFLLRAAALLSARIPNLGILIVGDGPCRQMLEEEAGLLGIADKTCFLGFQPDVRPYLPLLDVFVMPSRFESFGLTLVEAMAVSLPVVASRVGAIPEVVADGETGILVPVEDAEALAGAIHTYLTDPELRRQSGTAGRRRAEQLFSVEAMAKHSLSLYQELLQAREAA